MKSNVKILEAVVRAAYDLSRAHYDHPELTHQDIQETFVYDKARPLTDVFSGRDTRVPVGADVGDLHDIPVNISARVHKDKYFVKSIGRINYSIDEVVVKAREYIKNG